MLTQEQQRQVFTILYPHGAKRAEEVKAKKTRFVHYTTAQAAIGILTNSEIWMRQPACMNDYREVDHGLNCLRSAYNNLGSNRLKPAIDGMFDGLSVEIEKLFDPVLNALRQDLYLICFSEHDDTEDKLGRLSMWRAYGQGTGVAIVFKQEAFFKEATAFRSYSMPVEYVPPSQYLLRLNEVAENIAKNSDFLKSLGREMVKNLILQMFKNTVVATKHEGFIEEKEWRVVYAPLFEKSDYLKHHVDIINGVPQEIFKLPIQNIPEQRLTDFTIPDLLDRVIVGPTAFPFTIYKAFVQILTKAGVENPGSKVFTSDIPLRRQ